MGHKMTIVQLLFGVFLAAVFPTVTALVGIILGRRNSGQLRNEFRSDLRDIRVEIMTMHERLATIGAK
jgi:hypothetical protein